MAQATITRGGNIRVYLGNDGNPIVYKYPCGLTSNAIKFDKATSDEKIPDCDDPNKIAWLGRNVTSLSMDIDGEGVLAQESVVMWADAMESGVSLPAKVEWVFPKLTLTWTGRIMVTAFNVNANDQDIAKVSVTMKSDGEMVRVTTPATPDKGN